jgi:carbamoyl-phosphate synthase large subunit
VVVKVPKWNFEKFADADPTLGPQMKSVGEVMAIGRTFKEALLKGLRSLEAGKFPLSETVDPDKLTHHLVTPLPERLSYVCYALSIGQTVGQVHELTKIDPWFLHQILEIVGLRSRIQEQTLETLPPDLLLDCKQAGFSDQMISELVKLEGGAPASEAQIRQRRHEMGLRPVFKRVDTCAAEFQSFTPYLYSSYEEECEAGPGTGKKVVILGSGPNRVGQGIEFDYCCCHASFALREVGFETIMINCNPETVSTDYDTSDRLYFEPLTLEDVLEILHVEKPTGVIVQLGGQTPLNLALKLREAGIPILGTSPDSIDLAEDRERFGRLLRDLQIPHPRNGFAKSLEEAREVAVKIGYPILIRPSYVLGGRAMSIVFDQESLDLYLRTAVDASPEHPILIDEFLEDAFEYDVDAVSDGERVFVAGIMEHVEEAGIHSGDSTCVLPPIMIKPELRRCMEDYTHQLALALGVIGLMNIQFAVKSDIVYVLEVNPRASRTVPYVSKAIGVPLAKVAARLMIGENLQSLGLDSDAEIRHCFVKAPVFPFDKFPRMDRILGPEMKATGEVMGVAERFGNAFAKAQLAAGVRLPKEGRVFLSVNHNDRANLLPIARSFRDLQFQIIATSGTRQYLVDHEIPADFVFKVGEGRPNVVDYIKSGKIDLIVNTPLGRQSHYDEKAIRRSATQEVVPCITTLSGAAAAVNAIREMRIGTLEVKSLQEYHRPDATDAAG